MVRNQHHPLRKPILNTPIRQLSNLPPNTLIPTNMNPRRRPPLRHRENEKRHSFLRIRHIAVVRVAVNDIERKADILGYSNTGGGVVLDVRMEDVLWRVWDGAYTKQQDQK